MINYRYVLYAGLLIVVATGSLGSGNGEIRRIAGTLAMVDTLTIAAPAQRTAAAAEPAIVIEDEEPAGCVDAAEAAAPQTGFAFPDDALGALVRERLTPPRQVATEPV